MRVVATVGVVSLIVAGCSGDDGEETTTTLPGPVTTLETAAGSTGATSGGAATTTRADGGSNTTTTAGESQGLPEYEIAYRENGEPGATVVVLLDPASYTSLSDLDLQDVIRDVYDLFPPVWIAHVVDTEDAAGLVVLERALTEEERSLLDVHYLARLEDGIRIVYEGPFEAFPIAILGS